ncbi:MAG TPA: hypothetical protein VN947_20450 [Polyangia bacterium]|nr:hypothetical protein [Polyangia bacterium]
MSEMTKKEFDDGFKAKFDELIAFAAKHPSHDPPADATLTWTFNRSTAEKLRNLVRVAVEDIVTNVLAPLTEKSTLIWSPGERTVLGDLFLQYYSASGLKPNDILRLILIGPGTGVGPIQNPTTNPGGPGK